MRSDHARRHQPARGVVEVQVVGVGARVGGVHEHVSVEWVRHHLQQVGPGLGGGAQLPREVERTAA